MKKFAIGLVAGAIAFGYMALPVLADAGDHASCNGATHGAFASINGNFGFLGELGGTPGYHDGAVGQDFGATGYKNSHVECNP